MKKVILTSLFLALFFCNAYSADEGSIYTYFVTTPDGQYETLFLNYDRNVDVDGKNYQRYVGSYLDQTYADYLVLLRREEKKYFYYDSKTSEEHLLLDFDLQKGDTFTDDFSGIIYDVIDVRDSLINDSLHRLIEIQDCENTGKHDIWLEDVGSIYTGILPKDRFKDVCLLICYHFHYSTEEDVEYSAYFYPNTSQIKAAGMSVTEPQWDKDFKPEEDWDAFLAWLHAPTDLNAEFENDTLHIWGRLRTSCSIQTYAACELNGDKITFMVYPYNNLLDEDCISSYEVETRIPGFERGHYELKLYNKTIELECAGAEEPQEYFPEGTKWTEIRLDTLKFNNWYSKVGNEWVPNFETIEYYVQGEFLDRYDNVPLKCVYSNGPEWSDSLTLLVRERMYDNTIEVNVPLFYEDSWGTLLEFPCSSEIYQFDWSDGKGLYYRDIMESNSTGEYPYCFFFGVINEIKEGDFGGVRPLKYVDLDGKAPYDPQEPGNTDTKGARIIQGIGVTEWNDGECLFGPPNPYFAFNSVISRTYPYEYEYEERHYRSMLVHFERDGEVLYDVWPEKIITGISATLNDKGKMINDRLFDLSGRRLSGKPARGIFIEDGKKMMIK